MTADSLPVSTLEQTLLASLADGFIASEIVNQWTAFDGKAADSQLVADVIIRAGEADLKSGLSANVGAASLGLAFLSRDGQARWVNPHFQDWVGDPAASIDCMALLRERPDGTLAIGLVETENFGVLTAFAAKGEDLLRWQSLAREMWGYDGEGAASALVLFAPSRAAGLVTDAARSLGFTPSECRLVVALLETPNLETTASRIGVTRDTAKDMVRSAAAKAGVRTAQGLVGRVVDLSCGAAEAPDVPAPDIQRAWNLSPAEARVASALALGQSAKATAQSLGLSPQTVTTYRRQVFQKAGVKKVRDLRRLITELSELQRLAGASELVAEPGTGPERLRVLATARNRRIAFIDYGAVRQRSQGGGLVILGHGYTTGRLAPPPLLDLLRAKGCHVVALQRPGFGLTSTAPFADYLDTSADDLSQVVRALGYDRADLIARDGCIASATQTVRRYPGLLRRVILVNPRQPASARARQANPFSALTRLLAANPGLIEPFAEMLRRQSRTDAIIRTLQSFSEPVDEDAAWINQPGVAEFLARDSQGLNARTMAGFIAEQRLFVLGWEIPEGLESAQWSLVYGQGGWTFDADVWAGLPDCAVIAAPGAGWLVNFSQPSLIAGQIELWTRASDAA